MQHNHRNFLIANGVNALFFSGYLILKFPLSFILTCQGIPLEKAYSLTTTASVAFALCSLALSIIMKNYHDQKHAFLIGMILNLLAVIFLEQNFIRIGLSCYAVGGSLYFFNITILFNKQFNMARTRLYGNYAAQICLNIGAFVGCIVFLYALKTKSHYFVYSIGLITTAILCLLVFYKAFQDTLATLLQHCYLYVSCLLMFLFVFICLNHNVVTRWLVLAAFLIAITIAITQSIKKRSQGYFLFIILILFFSLPFWICNTILYNQFFVFLHDNVYSIFGYSATTIILIDPIGNIIFGLFWVAVTSQKPEQPYFNLQLGMVLIVVAFCVVSAGIYTHSDAQRIPVFYPLVTILLFSSAQFLIQPTMHSRVRDLITNHEHMVFALGILRSVRAFAAVLAFYMIDATVQNNQLSIARNNLILYSTIACVTLTMLVIFAVLKLRSERQRINLSFDAFFT